MKIFGKNYLKFFCLAPMTDVTDCVFRQIITKYENQMFCGQNLSQPTDLSPLMHEKTFDRFKIF